MPDLWNILLEKLRAPKWLKVIVDHNRGAFLALSVSAVAICVVAGCQPTVKSPISGNKVTRLELDAEVQVEVAKLQAMIEGVKIKAGASYALLEAQEAVINEGLKALNGLVAAVPGPWQPLAGGILSAATLGLGIDNIRKRGQITKAKKATPTDGG